MKEQYFISENFETKIEHENNKDITIDIINKSENKTEHLTNIGKIEIVKLFDLFQIKYGVSKTKKYNQKKKIEEAENATVETIREYSYQYNNSINNALSFYSNGYQSWSLSKEYVIGEKRYPYSKIGVFDRFVQNPGKIKFSNKYYYSNMFTYFKKANNYIAIASINEGYAPTLFGLNRKSFELEIMLYTGNIEYKKDEIIQKYRVKFCESYEELNNFFKNTYTSVNFNHEVDFANIKKIYGWESWYNHYNQIDEKLILENLKGLENNNTILSDYKKDLVFQIDDGWENEIGDWTVNKDRFPNGMKSLADKIKAKGYSPGIWIAPFVVTKQSKIYKDYNDWVLKDENGKPVVCGFIPGWGKFHSLDLSIQDVQNYIEDLFDTLVNKWGYTFLKLDFLYVAMFNGCFKNGKAPFYWYEKMLEKISRFKSTMLGCGAPIENSYRYFPLMRIGADTKEQWEDRLTKFINHQGRPSAYISLINTIERSFLDKNLFINDPDVIFCRRNNIKLNFREKELIGATNYLFASQIMISDDILNEEDIDKEITKHLKNIYQQVNNRKFGYYKLIPNIYFIYSFDYKYIGVINLSNSNCPIDLLSSTEFFLNRDAQLDKILCENVKRKPGKTLYMKHSISLYENTLF